MKQHGLACPVNRRPRGTASDASHPITCRPGRLLPSPPPPMDDLTSSPSPPLPQRYTPTLFPPGRFPSHKATTHPCTQRLPPLPAAIALLLLLRGLRCRGRRWTSRTSWSASRTATRTGSSCRAPRGRGDRRGQGQRNGCAEAPGVLRQRREQGETGTSSTALSSFICLRTLCVRCYAPVTPAE